ncbi:MAG TPA: AAA family ATPase [Acidimicrobiales bacterium]|nr:AAA family ATPase [Acidimicrobiales bacterium]
MVRVHVVGRVAVEVDGEPVALPPGRATEVLAWLAAHPGMHPRSRVAPVFWPDVTDATARASLRTALWSLRKALGPAGESVLALDRSSVGLEGEGLWVDVRDPDVDGAGDLLPGIEAEWADEVRADHRRALVARLSQADDVDAARRLAALDPFSEEHHRLLLGRLVATGEQAAALREHEAFRRRLWDELRLRPSPATRDYVRQLAAPSEPQRPPLPARLARADSELFVGRDEEHERLRDAWRAVRDGHGPRVALVCGEPGIGKSCLAARFAAEVHADGGTVLFGEAAEDELLPAEPFLEALGEHHSLTPAELVETVRHRLEAAAAHGPVLLVLDDFQWADSVSFAVLRRLARSQAAARLAVLVSFRPEESAKARFAALEDDLGRGRQLERIDLGPLSAVSTGMLLGRLDPDGVLAPRAERIHLETGGNPLFVRELGRYLLDVPSGSSVPDTVRTLVAARLHRLAPATVETLLAAAVLGLRAELHVLRHMVAPELDVLAALDEAASATLMDEEAAGVHVFRHALVRDAVYEGMSKSRRAELHRRAAEAIRAVHGDEGRHLCDIAEHRCAAVPADSAAAAVDDARRAGEWAVDHHAYDRAVVVLTKALPFADEATRPLLTVRRAVAYQRLSHAIFDR